jgi:hypothetical protein
MSRYKNPADAAMPYLEQVPDTVTPYYTPYRQMGMGAAALSFPQYGRMSVDPEGYYADIMGGYTESPGAQYQQQQLQKSMSGTSAAGGYTGTPYDQQQQAEQIQGIISRDQQQYLNNILGIQKTGLGGEQHFFDVGYSASDTLAQMLASNLAQEAGVAFEGQQYENYMKSQERNNMMKALTTGAGVGGGIYAARPK